ncbi:MAG: DUF3108 domain-containing protein [Bacteroidota bacterium]|nr:DUF3108 domain-containing protein [Bacteroidota bacterium]
MKKILLFLFLLPSFFISAQKYCPVINTAFQAGEQFNYQIFYNWGAIWMNAGEASFSTKLTEMNGRSVYHFVGLGSTYPKYDWFYKVRDRYESYADTSTLRPLRFKREANEGGNHTFDDYVFNQKKNKVYTAERRNTKPTKLDSLSITSCTNDVMTAIFYARCLDFEKYKPNDTISITFVLDGKVYPSYIRYIGKETITTTLLGKVRCIKFRPKLIEGTLFKGGEGMTVWVTDDENKMPVYVETPIVVGSVKVQLSAFTGLRNPMNCLVPK